MAQRKQLTDTNRARVLQVVSLIGRLNHLIKLGRVKVEIDRAGRLRLVH